MFRIILSSVMLGALCTGVLAQTTEFTYQGSLNVGTPPGTPANGTYDFDFRLWDAATLGNMIGPTLLRNGVVVVNGSFSVNLNFGDVFPGTPRYLDIGVKLAGGPAYTTLFPRQQIKSTPYAIQAQNAGSVGGFPPGGFIQNRTSQQPSSNFNISGNGIIGGNVGIGTTAPVGNLHINVPGSGNPISALTLDVGTFGTPGNAVNSHYFKVRDIGSGGAPAFLIRGDGNVGIGSSSPAATLEVNGYTKLGSDAPSIKVKTLTGTTPSTEGGSVTIPHGLDATKILSVSVMVNYTASFWVGPDSSYNSNTRFSWVFASVGIGIINNFGASGGILSKPIRILIIYEQ